jgi:hypothetical protein
VSEPKDRPPEGPQKKADGEYQWDDSRSGKTVGSWSFDDERHWSRLRKGKNQEAMDYYRQRSKAPGVAEGGGVRSSYCLECDGVIPLKYDQRTEAELDLGQVCPHCGATVDPRVRRMFNWVEIDQPPASDLAYYKPFLLVAGLILLGGLALFGVYFLG